MLMVKILAKLREAYRGESLPIEGIVVAAAQITVQPEYQHGFHAHYILIGAAHIGDIARHLPRWRIVLAAQPADPADLLLRGRGGKSLGKDAHNRAILLRALVSADNVIVQYGFDIPGLLFCHLREVLAAVQSLLFTRHCQKDNRGWKLQLAQDPCAFQADGGSAAIVVRPRSVGLRV